MRSFYSILTVPIRSAGQEWLNVGLLFAGDERVLFKFSSQKLSLIKRLIPDSSFAFLRSYLFSLSETLDKKESGLTTQFGTSDFVSYLSRYNNNLLTFSKPAVINLEVNDKNFRSLFEKLVFSFSDDIQQAQTPERFSIGRQLKSILYPRIKNRVNLDQLITPAEVPTLLVPSVKVNFIGHNNFPVAGQAIDFQKSPERITNGISRLISLIKAFDMTKTKGQYYIIGEEPKKALKEQHDNWRHIRESSLVEFVGIDEVERISKYIETHDVKPFVVSE